MITHLAPPRIHAPAEVAPKRIKRSPRSTAAALEAAQTVRTGAREPSKQWVPGTLNSFMVESTVAAAAAMAAARVTIVRCETIVVRDRVQWKSGHLGS